MIRIAKTGQQTLKSFIISLRIYDENSKEINI
jgi:hypothetical protein